MDIKNFDLARKKYQELIKIDNEIIKLEKLAAQLANDDFEVKVEINFNNLSSIIEKAQNILDEDGSLINQNHEKYKYTPYNPYLSGEIHRVFRLGDYNHEDKNENSIKLNIDENESLYLIQPLINIKNIKRMKIIKQMKSLGVNI